MTNHTHGLIAATFTPMKGDGSLNLSLIPAITDHLVANGITGIYVAGSTGEGVSLTTDERRAVAEAYIDAAAGRLTVFVQVGQDCVEQARQLAAHAQSVGASAVSAVTPTYFKPTTIEAVVASMAHIAAGAPELPFYYYHIPTVTGVAIDMVAFLACAGRRIPNLAGIKYTAPTLHEYQQCVEFDGGRYDVLFGFDEMLLPALAVGATAAIGSTYNFSAPVYHRLMAAFAKGDIETARRWQSRSIDITRAFGAYGGREAQKAMMGMIGFDCGPCRPPLTTLPADRTSALRKDLDAVDFFKLAAEASAAELTV